MVSSIHSMCCVLCSEGAKESSEDSCREWKSVRPYIITYMYIVYYGWIKTYTVCPPAPLPPVTHPGSPPQLQPYLSVPAGLQFTAQLVELVAGLLDTPLPYPLHRHLYIL